MKKLLSIVALTFCVIFLFSACNTDVVGKVAVTSFEKLQKIAKTTKEDKQTIITTPTGNRFEYGENFTAISIPVEPFIKAGLDTTKLPSYFTVENKMLVIKQNDTAKDFKTFVKKYRDKIGYHEALDHYGIDMGNGNKFEWAKDTKTNDKDIVFVLNPEPLKNAGVIVEKVEGFVYAEVEVKKGVKEFKLLSPYDLNGKANEKAVDTAKETESSVSDKTVETTPVADYQQVAQTSIAQDTSVSKANAETQNNPASNSQPQKSIQSAGQSGVQTSVATPAVTTEASSVPKAEEKFDGILIQKNEITSTAKFFPYTADGVKMEVFAVKSSDGVIHTAFNTCQVCYDSGRGYYVQKGDVFVCQNCGNRFNASDIGKSKGGCNPVPLADDLKIEDEISIKIPASTLNGAKELFSDWKR